MKTRRMIVQNLNRSSRRSQRRKSAATFRILRFLCVLLFIYSCCPSVCCSFEPVRAEIGKETAWTGEAVPLIITLYSPGPFSGTALNSMVKLSGYNSKRLGTIADEQLRRMSRNRRVRNPRLTSGDRFSRNATDETVIILNREVMTEYGLSVAEALGLPFDGR